MKKLIKGIVDFRKNSLTKYREKFSKLALEHKPDALFIACCDSRVVPNTFASSDPGDLFVVRNIGNLVPAYHVYRKGDDISTAAAIEFSVLELNVANIIICGHSECAAMRAFTEGLKPNFEFINNWLVNALPSYQRWQANVEQSVKLSKHNQLSQINVLQQIEHLKTYPWVTERIANQKLGVHGWWFDLETADVYHYDNDSKEFLLIDETILEKLIQNIKCSPVEKSVATETQEKKSP